MDTCEDNPMWTRFVKTIFDDHGIFILYNASSGCVVETVTLNRKNLKMLFQLPGNCNGVTELLNYLGKASIKNPSSFYY